MAKGKMFLADERGCTETDWFRNYHTLNYENYFNAHKSAFGSLYVLNDHTLAGGQTVKTGIAESTYVLLLPVVGAIVFKNNNGIERIVHAGNMQVLYLDKPAVMECRNPYEDGLVNFIELRIKAGVLIPEYIARLLYFNLDNDKNKLIPVTAGATGGTHFFPNVSIGKFTGRNEAVYRMNHPQNTLFVFVIAGAFEVQGRLLHARDGLGMWDDTNDIELEALSNDAIVLLVELYQNNLSPFC